MGVCASAAEVGGAPLELGVGRTGMVDGGGIARVAGDGGTWTAMMNEYPRFAPSKGREGSERRDEGVCAVMNLCLVRAGRLSYVVPAAMNDDVELDEMDEMDVRDGVRCDEGGQSRL